MQFSGFMVNMTGVFCQVGIDEIGSAFLLINDFAGFYQVVAFVIWVRACLWHDSIYSQLPTSIFPISNIYFHVKYVISS